MDSLDMQIQSILRSAEQNGSRKPTLRQIASATGVSAQTVMNRLRKMNGTYSKDSLYESKRRVRAENEDRLRKELEEYIKDFKSIYGIVPTRRQMMEAININSVSKLYKLLEDIGVQVGDSSSRCNVYGERVKQVYKYIKEYKIENGKSPSINQIVECTDCISPSDVLRCLNGLEKNGMIEIDIVIK